MEIFVDDDTKLTLHGLQQYFVRLDEAQKNRKLNDLLDALEFNQVGGVGWSARCRGTLQIAYRRCPHSTCTYQILIRRSFLTLVSTHISLIPTRPPPPCLPSPPQVVIFVSKVNRAIELNRILEECNFPSIVIHAGLKQEERIARFKSFKEFNKRILVSTDLFGRGIDIERVNIVINYDFPDQSDQYLHRVGRAGRFGTKGLAISFISRPEDETEMQKVQDRFAVQVPELPETIDTASYM